MKKGRWEIYQLKRKWPEKVRWENELKRELDFKAGAEPRKEELGGKQRGEKHTPSSEESFEKNKKGEKERKEFG